MSVFNIIEQLDLFQFFITRKGIAVEIHIQMSLLLSLIFFFFYNKCWIKGCADFKDQITF